MMKKLLSVAGLLIYHVGAYIALPIFLSGTRRTRVALIDTDKKKILLSKTVISAQKWSLVGGGIKKNEDVVAGAVREILEETGLEIDPKSLTYHKEQTQAEKNVTYQAIYYSAKLKNVEIDASRFEILDLQWFDPRKLPKDTGEYTREFVSELLQN